ncbi:ABC transporter permease subunit [Bradyrhizobium sp. ISRA443]|uniref:ABC transporter permease subunit n=1 Tax=unclassified Bradyrhizobium TaxID=2631580 RepID=UPI00247A436A|nr:MULTISPECIES: ABC transporter permease subunit [unclassified Bradyrhizobium]WGR93404.1 ABC transporter permease subunit [Bradyrhizobium sp. ISRA435]WGR97944.1 ABC transporter permease subunit [Bradyrhizobium sp. ISRA436]WGS04834.1 ABC transporter permease subunit [Bradyrhizobium sp. ISRA437]WGS11715.1 ABC transporter permease subunit [Bradyrhizobium sp. ISRA443]
MPIWLTVPAFAILLIVFGIPIMRLFLSSLDAPAFSIANYQAFFAQRANVLVLLQTVKISAVATVICVIIGYPTAYLIVAVSKRLRVVLIVLILIPFLTSGLARTYAWVVILGSHGLINNLLLDLRLISSPLSLIYNRMAVYIGMVHIMLPVMILPLVSVMLGIDKSLMAAASSMGARPLSAFWRVFFPLSLPGVRSGSMLVFIFCLGFYITPVALGGLRDAMLSTFIVAQVESAFNLAQIATTAFILLGIAAIMLSLVGLDLSSKQGLAVQPARKYRSSRLPVLGALRKILNELATRFRVRRWISQLYRARGGSRWLSIIGTMYVGLVMVFLLFPELIVIVMSFSAGPFLEFPPSGFSLHWYYAFFDDPSWTGALWASIQIGIAVTALSTIVGMLAAYGLSRAHPRLRGWLTMAILTPITFPAIVVAVAIYFGLIKLGLIGTKTGIILAHTIGAMGSVVVIVSATLANFDRRLEQAAMSMRAGPLRTFTRVTLPLIRPGIIGGAVFAFIHSFDEVVITSLVNGLSIYTLPLKMWQNMQNQIDPTIAAVASLLTLLPVLWLVALYVTWWRSRLNSRCGVQALSET